MFTSLSATWLSEVNITCKKYGCLDLARGHDFADSWDKGPKYFQLVLLHVSRIQWEVTLRVTGLITVAS